MLRKIARVPTKKSGIAGTDRRFRDNEPLWVCTHATPRSSRHQTTKNLSFLLILLRRHPEKTGIHSSGAGPLGEFGHHDTFPPENRIAKCNTTAETPILGQCCILSGHPSAPLQ